jgi:hypothetical protein
MSNKKQKSGEDWQPIIFLLVVLPIAFTFGGVWLGIPILVIGFVVLGWRKRHNGPFPTNKPGMK